MSVPPQYNKYEEYFYDTLSFLEEYSWLFDTAATKVLVNNVLCNLPCEWKPHLLDLNNDELNALPTGYIKVYKCSTFNVFFSLIVFFI